MNDLAKGISIMKNRVLRVVLMLALTAVLSFTYSSEVHASMSQDEFVEWLKQWCEENGKNFEDCMGTGGTRTDLYVGNNSNSASNTSPSSDASATTSAPKHEHQYAANLTTNPTCTEEGVMTYTCSCGDSYTESYPALGHDYQSETSKEATCQEEGEVIYTCSLCGDIYTETIPKTEHKSGGKVVTKEATCTESGEKKVFCKVCNTELSSEEIPAVGHVESEWTVVKINGMFTEGEQAKTCTACGEVLQNEVIESRIPVTYLYTGIGTAVVFVIVVGIVVYRNRKKRK